MLEKGTRRCRSYNREEGGGSHCRGRVQWCRGSQEVGESSTADTLKEVFFRCAIVWIRITV